MAVNIQAELETQLNAVNDKLVALNELLAQKARLEATLQLLKGEITLENFKPSKAKTGAPRGTMTEMHKSKIKLSNLKRRLAEEPKNAELQRKVKDIEALIKSLDK